MARSAKANIALFISASYFGPPFNPFSASGWESPDTFNNFYGSHPFRPFWDLLNTLDTIAKKGAGFKSLADAWANTTTPHGRLMLTVLGGLAEFERELIRARTGEGRARAKARGIHMGRPAALTPHQQAEARQRRDNGETLMGIARTYGVSHTTISRL